MKKILFSFLLSGCFSLCWAQFPGPESGSGLPPAGMKGVPPKPLLTEPQRVVAALPPPGPGGLIPAPGYGSGDPLPSKEARDLEGVWYHNQPLEVRIQNDMYGLALPYSMAGAEVIRRRVESASKGKPYVNASAVCRPPGQTWQHDLHFPFSIYQSEHWIELVFEEFHGRWKIHLDPDAKPETQSAEYMGHSIGYWEGNTLVVTTSGFKQGIWLDVDGTPLSKSGTLTHRIRKVHVAPYKTILEFVITVNDPAYYTEPWSVVRSFEWQPKLAVFKEYNCEEQIGDPAVRPDAGLVAEPT